MFALLMSLSSLSSPTLEFGQAGHPYAGVIEAVVTGTKNYSNPYDSDEAAVDAAFEGPSGRKLTLPAFWDGSGFRFRFRPTQTGKWRVTARVTDKEGVTTLPTKEFEAKAEPKHASIAIAEPGSRYFKLETGEGFFPIGINVCWPGEEGVSDYKNLFGKLRAAGGNFTRIWTTAQQMHESKEVGLGRFDQKALAYYDEVFKLAAENEIRVMYTFDDYRVLAKEDFFVAHWDKSPYNAANGGPLKEPLEFFTNPLCTKIYKDRLRMLVARYTAMPAIGIWEIWNEQDHIEKPGVPIEWFREMTGHLAALDPYKHPISTSYSWDDKAEVWESPHLHMTQRHMYGQGDTLDFVAEVVKNGEKLQKFGKPRLISEFGITWKEPDIALDKAKKGTPLHNAIWASIMTGESGAPLTWWWDNYIEPAGLWGVITGASRFVEKIDFAASNFNPVKVESSQGLTSLGMVDSKSGSFLAWVCDPESHWKNDAEGKVPKQFSGVTLSLPVPGSGAYAVEVWDTRKGVVVSTPEAKPQGGIVKVSLPVFVRDVAVKGSLK